MPRKLTEISVLAELDRAGVKYDYSGTDDVKIKCPFHQDEHPSCDVSVTKRVFKCKAAGCKVPQGDFVTLLAGIVNRSRAVVLEELGTRYDLGEVKIVELEAIMRWHANIWRAGPLLQALYDRAVTDEDIVEFKLGEDQGRITIPVPNERGDYVNVRRYLPGAPGNEKMKNQRGRGSAQWFPVDQLAYDKIMLCGGEVKSIVALRQLNPHGVGAACMTLSEDLLPPKLLQKLAGKTVYVCMDIDAHGRAAAEKNCAALMPLAAEIFDVLLPLDFEKHPKGDVNDFVKLGGDLWEVIQKCEPWAGPTRNVLLRDEEPIKLHMAEATRAKNAAKRVMVTGHVTAMVDAPYVVPKTVRVKCDKSMGFCSVCPVWNVSDPKFDVHPEHPSILSMVSATKSQIPEAIMEGVGIPKACRVCEFDVEAYYNAEDARLSPQLEITERAADQKLQPAICIGEGLETNASYELVGRMYPHPKTQQSTLLISKYDATQDALGTYVPRDLDKLEAFCPAEWTMQGVQDKLDHIYDDLERNVTRIWQRRDMHAVIDFAYHSPLLLRLDNRVMKGWVEVLIVGDSAQGKSEASQFMQKHYGLGERIECKNATAAGLIGGAQQLSNGRWFITWGFIPMHDKGLVILEELKGTKTETIGQLTDMRSSGIAELAKIEKRRTHARTRIVGISNPRFDRRMDSFSFGLEAARELIGSPEDLRRFDCVHIVAADEVDANVINIKNMSLNGSHPTYGSELCRALVLWSWTRGPEQCTVPKDSSAECIRLATEMSEEFSDAIPIVDRGSMRHKLARLAAAVAARTFSADETREQLVVRPCHVQWVADFLRRTYSTRAFGYREFTDAAKSVASLSNPDKIKKHFNAMPFPAEVVESFLRADRIDVQDIQDWTGWDRTESLAFMSVLVRQHALRRNYKSYQKTGPFIQLLKGMSTPGKPDFIPEADF